MRATPIRIVLADPRARRVAFAYAIFVGAESAVWVALMVYAYGHGGAAEAGLVALTQLVPAAGFAPIAGVIAERNSPVKVLVLGYWVQAGALGAASVTFALDGPPLVMYACVMVMSIAIVTTRPAQALVTPRLVQDPDELTALNVVSESAAQGAMFAAPAFAAGLLAIGDVGSVFATFAVALVVAALAVPQRSLAVTTGGSELLRTTWREVRSGVQVAIREPAVRLVLIMSGLGFVTVGAIDVLMVGVAIDRLDGTASDAAWMAAALGAGGIAGAALGGFLVGRRLAPAFAVAAVESGAVLAVIGIAPNIALVGALLFLAGIGQAVIGIATQSLLQRCSPTGSIGRIFALRECLYSLGLAAGSILAPALIHQLGIGGAFIIIGLLLPTATLLRLTTIWQLDLAATTPIVELTLLREVPIFHRLLAPALEGLAHNATHVRFPAGGYLMRQGEAGNRYIAIADGTAEVIRDGLTIARVSRADGVGETALLRQVPRTASVRAVTPVHGLAITQEEFLVAVTGHDGDRSAEPTNE